MQLRPQAARRSRASCAGLSATSRAGIAAWRAWLSLLTGHGVARVRQLSQLRVLEPGALPFSPDEATASNPCLADLTHGLHVVVRQCGALWQGVLCVFAPPSGLIVSCPCSGAGPVHASTWGCARARRELQ
jgi:hypothetical protein